MDFLLWISVHSQQYIVFSGGILFKISIDMSSACQLINLLYTGCVCMYLVYSS